MSGGCGGGLFRIGRGGIGEASGICASTGQAMSATVAAKIDRRMVLLLALASRRNVRSAAMALGFAKRPTFASIAFSRFGFHAVVLLLGLVFKGGMQRPRTGRPSGPSADAAATALTTPGLVQGALSGQGTMPSAASAACTAGLVPIRSRWARRLG